MARKPAAAKKRRPVSSRSKTTAPTPSIEDVGVGIYRLLFLAVSLERGDSPIPEADALALRNVLRELEARTKRARAVDFSGAISNEKTRNLGRARRTTEDLVEGYGSDQNVDLALRIAEELTLLGYEVSSETVFAAIKSLQDACSFEGTKTEDWIVASGGPKESAGLILQKVLGTGASKNNTRKLRRQLEAEERDAQFLFPPDFEIYELLLRSLGVLAEHATWGAFVLSKMILGFVPTLELESTEPNRFLFLNLHEAGAPQSRTAAKRRQARNFLHEQLEKLLPSVRAAYGDLPDVDRDIHLLGDAVAFLCGSARQTPSARKSTTNYEDPRDSLEWPYRK